MGADLSKQFGVSRQVMVQDVAVLRAHGMEIIATPKGYILPTRGPTPQRDVLHVQHDRDAIFDELSVLVDLGIMVIDVAVEHPVYGSIRGDLPIASRLDAQEYIQTLERTGSLPLLGLVGDHRHSHTVEAARPDLLEKAREELC